MNKPKPPPEDSAVALSYDMTAAVQSAFNLPEGLASHFAIQLTDALRRQLGGQEIYIPAPDKQARDAAIRAEFNGRNRAEVCARYNISRSRLYEIVRAERSE